MKLKYSRQREAIIECLKNRHDHPTADALFQALRLNNPRISLGTVYRNLGLLTELGKINRISCGDGIERYDYITDKHDHFVCRKCGKIIDLDPKLTGDIKHHAVHTDIGRVDSHALIFYGQCRDCLDI
ncbi:Fur family transcriptional regulator [Johnsonella ignava]|uniref:Fur family transcriptional regulator n=1 Tax=Johnsonella ignava TaxID=43995 RepID=UPI0023F50EA9|nr:transcriptional repressor [Johnsonella ignava]